ncbi:MAG: MotA/TolQ/ExbB proton channel family protein [Lachnospiraceae bacterium]|nr:MotA/TolQ/ExbB proton channel family protein [Lachnospiraceae bacterium]
MSRKGFETIILLTYFAMLGVCLFFNLFSKGQAAGIENLIVNIVMFVIVGIIFIVCITGSLWPAANITWDLNRVSAKIEDDARHTRKFLWDRYNDEKEELFRDRILSEQFKDYKFELERTETAGDNYYRCDIGDYIGLDLIDSVIHREQLSQVAGAMTGLGILGTFIGLSLGLQSFNTGTTAEITNSIEPLMDGIKVAFHTSIYGMVFSLVFNYVYRRRLGEAEDAVRNFLSAYKKYVMPDTRAEGVNRLMELEKQQTEAIKGLSDAVRYGFSDSLKAILDPHFDRLNDTVEDFADMATRNQMEQMSKVVSVFIAELNNSLDQIFTNLSDTMNRTLVIQGENEKQMQEIYNKNLTTAENVNVISTQTRSVVASLRQYVDEIQEMESTVEKELELLKKQSERSEKLGEAFPREVEDTFKTINENLRGVETHFRDSVDRINDSMERLPESVDYSLRSVEKALKDVSASMDEFSAALRDYRRK